MIQDLQADPQPAESHDDQIRSILIIDDDEAQVAALAHRFKTLGFATLLAHDGRQGIRLAEQRHPDLVLLDLRLPDLTGFEVCEHLTSEPRTCDIPIIIVSGMEQADIVRRSRAAGCRYYLRKPYDPNSLLCLVENALNEVEEW